MNMKCLLFAIVGFAFFVEGRNSNRHRSHHGQQPDVPEGRAFMAKFPDPAAAARKISIKNGVPIPASGSSGSGSPKSGAKSSQTAGTENSFGASAQSSSFGSDHGGGKSGKESKENKDASKDAKDAAGGSSGKNASKDAKDAAGGSSGKDDTKIPDACKKVVTDFRESFFREQTEIKERELREQTEIRERELLERERILKEEAMKPKINENPITTDMIDSATGKPAQNLKVSTWRLEENNEWTVHSEKVTNTTGKASHVISPEKFIPGIYKLHFDTKTYYNDLGLQTIYPFIDIVFEVKDAAETVHISLLISPYGYSTNRGAV